MIGTGAYTAGILDNLYQPPIWVCLVAGALAAVTGGLVLALPALRVRGPYFGLTTLVAVLMLQNFFVVDAGLTGGEIGLTVPDVISISDTTNYLIALWFMAISGAVLFALSRSPVGLILQARGQDAVQAGALGFNVTKHKLTAFVISAFFSGLRLLADPATDERARAIAARVGLTNVLDRRPGTLPFADLRKIEIAKAIARDPQVLLIDEPFAGLTSAETTSFSELICELRDDGRVVLLVDHNVKSVSRLVDRVLAMYVGERIA